MHTFKNTFEIPLFLIKKVREQTAAFDYYKYGLRIVRMTNRWFLQKKLYDVVTFDASSVVSSFKTLLSKFMLETLATLLAFSKAGLKCE